MDRVIQANRRTGKLRHSTVRGLAMNRHYQVNGIEGIETYIELLSEVDGGFEARITSTSETGIRESCEFVSSELLESCIRTGYLRSVSVPAPRHAVLTA
jgi:hypothetical protein